MVDEAVSRDKNSCFYAQYILMNFISILNKKEGDPSLNIPKARLKIYKKIKEIKKIGYENKGLRVYGCPFEKSLRMLEEPMNFLEKLKMKINSNLEKKLCCLHYFYFF